MIERLEMALGVDVVKSVAYLKAQSTDSAGLWSIAGKNAS